MGSPYSYELRIRAIAALETEKSISKVARLFKMSRDTLHKWKNIKKNTGDIVAKKGYQKGHSNKITNLAEFEKFIIANKDKTLKELSRLSNGKFSSTTIWRGLKALGYSYKKNFSSSQKGYWSKGRI